ncbi:MAG: hypothetical protein EU549_04190 [Promethearchaeota archaeon]|nr:MAG: hypothetical protein EU549_04190 [Candidatus Lokiarchaeota archaeon]
MRWILDACTLIYLVKSKLFSDFINVIDYPLVIDTSVYKEVVMDGIANNYPDARIAKSILEEFKIPVISIDTSSEIKRFRDPGETSCFILSREEGVCLTSDDRAYKKFKEAGLKAIRLDTFYFEKWKQKKIDEDQIINILNRLENVNATKPKSIMFFLTKIYPKKEKINND